MTRPLVYVIAATVGFFVGAMIGVLVLAIVPGLIITILVYGADAYRAPQIIGAMMQPAALIGAITGSIGLVCAARRLP